MAEREGFEPSVTLPPHILSRDAHSTALASLRAQKGTTKKAPQHICVEGDDYSCSATRIRRFLAVPMGVQVISVMIFSSVGWASTSVCSGETTLRSLMR